MFPGMMSAAASLGLVLLWDIDAGLTQLDKYLYSKEDYIKVNLCTYIHTTVLRLPRFCQGQPKWAGTRMNITHSHLSWSSVVPYLLHPSITVHDILPVQFMCLAVFFHNLSPSFLWSTSWPGTLHFMYHTSPNHCLLFAAHAHTIATCFAVVPRLCHLILVCLSTLYLELCLVASSHTFI